MELDVDINVQSVTMDILFVMEDQKGVTYTAPKYDTYLENRKGKKAFGTTYCQYINDCNIKISKSGHTVPPLMADAYVSICGITPASSDYTFVLASMVLPDNIKRRGALYQIGGYRIKFSQVYKHRYPIWDTPIEATLYKALDTFKVKLTDDAKKNKVILDAHVTWRNNVKAFLKEACAYDAEDLITHRSMIIRMPGYRPSLVLAWEVELRGTKIIHLTDKHNQEEE